MKKGFFILVLVFSVFIFFVSSKAFAEVIKPDDVKRFYRTWSEEDKKIFENVILPSLRQEFKKVVYDPGTTRERQILGKRAYFYQLYRTLSNELSHQQEAPFRRYDHYTRISRSTLRLIMHAMASDTESIFYGIHDDVYDELFAKNDAPLTGFRQLTYEPLLREFNGVPLAVSFAAVAAVLAARALPDRRAKVAVLTIGGVLAIFGITGCSSQEVTWGTQLLEYAREEERGRVRRVSRSFLRTTYAWKDIEDEYVSIHLHMYRGLDDLQKQMQEGIEVDLDFSEQNKRELYASLFGTLIDSVDEYVPSLFRRNVDENDAEEEAEADEGGDGEREAPEIVVNENELWRSYRMFAQTFVVDPLLKTLIMNNYEAIKGPIIEFLKSEIQSFLPRGVRILLKLMHISFETQIQLDMSYDTELDRRDLHTLRGYILYLMPWIYSGENQEGMPGMPIFSILSDAERSVLLVTERPPDPFK